MNATPIHSEDGQLQSFVITLQDLTPLAEQERLRAEFLAMVSHELRSPLMSVKGSADTLAAQSARLDPAEMRQFFRIIQEQAEHMRGLIGDLLDVARIETGALSIEPEPSEVAALVEEAAARFRSGEARNPLRVELAEDLPMALADRRRVAQVLDNLLSNAAGYSPEGSPITWCPPSGMEFMWRCPFPTGAGAYRRKCCRSCSASSPGLPVGRRRPAWTGRAWGWPSARASWRPTGAASGPRATDPAWGPGSPSRCPSPKGTAAPAPPPPSPARSGRAARERVRVLAVDDDPQDLRYVRDVLTRAGYAPIVTGDPADVPRLMAEHRPHLALLDLVLPEGDGIGLMHDIQGTADVPVIFLSAYGQDDTVARALDMGAADYLVKPFSPTELAARIRAALRKRLEPFPGEPSGGSFEVAGLSIEYAQRRVAVDGEPVELTATEYAVLYELAVHAPRVLTHGALLQRVWGPERVGEAWLVRNVVKRLRRKLGDDAADPRYIVTEPRVGYRMAVEERKEGTVSASP